MNGVNISTCKFQIFYVGSQLPKNMIGYWIFSDDMNFNTGYPKATLESVDITQFTYETNNVKSIAPTMTGKWAPAWPSDKSGEIRVRIFPHLIII